MKDEAAKLLAVFREEAIEAADNLAQLLDALRGQRGHDAAAKIGDILRIAHNIKGAAATVDAVDIASTAHALESAVHRFRDSKSALNDADHQALLAAATTIERLASENVSGIDVAAMIACLDAIPQDPGSRPQGRKASTRAKKETETPVAVQEEPTPQDKGPHADEEVMPGGADATVRVETARLDRVIAFTGEMLATHARMTARSERLQQFFLAFQDTVRELPASVQDRFAGLQRQIEELRQLDRNQLLSLDHLTAEMSDAMKKVRMRPLAYSASFWRRTVRECAQQLGRQAYLTVEGGDIEVDKWVFERLRDPMIHLLRNAIGHGIEPAEERAAAGKPIVAQIRVKAAVRGTRVILEIADDGRGLDPKRIAEVAVAKGLVTSEQLDHMREFDVLMLILRPGFSTAENLSQISGRGVGLDVVYRNVKEIGGSVDVVAHSPLGGAAFVLTLPMSLLSTKGLLVRTSHGLYAIPIDCVVRTLRIPRQEIRKIEGGYATQIEQGVIVRLRSLTTLLDGSAEPLEDKISAVVVSRGEALLGLVVHEVVGEEEYVAKRLPWNVRSVAGVDGAVVLADSSLARTVDVPYLFQAAESGRGTQPESPSGTEKEERPMRVLLVDDSQTSLALESDMLANAGFEVVTAKDGGVAWKLLRSREFDVIVTDIEMPKVDGLELTRRIRADNALKEKPVILVTSHASAEDRAQGAAAGADEYLSKHELDEKRLIEAVKRWT
jgi:two-component system chemotaxis sensor kinase CheA